MGVPCSTCCESKEHKDKEYDLSNRKPPHKEHMIIPNSAKTTERRHTSRDWAERDQHNKIPEIEHPSCYSDQQGLHSKENSFNDSSQNAVKAEQSPIQDATHKASGLDAFNENRMLTLGHSAKMDSPQDSNSVDIYDHLSLISKMKKEPSVMVGIRESMEHLGSVKPQNPPTTNFQQNQIRTTIVSSLPDNLSCVNLDSINPGKLKKVAASTDQILKIPNKQEKGKPPIKGMSIDRVGQAPDSPFLSFHICSQPDPQGSASLIPGGQQPVRAGYLFSQDTAQRRLENSILRSRYDLAGDLSGDTLDFHDDGPNKQILKILTYDDFVKIDAKKILEMKYNKTLIKL